MIVAGIGSQKGVAPEAVLAAVDAALGTYGRARADLSGLYSSAPKIAEPGIVAAAHALGIGCHAVAEDALKQADARTLTSSSPSMAATGLASLSEAAALAGAGPDGRLLGPRIALGSVTCALAEAGGRT